MNLKELVQDVCGTMGLPVPTYVMSNPDFRVVQMKGLMNRFVDDLLIRKAWQAVRAETVFTSVASEDQGALSTLSPYGYKGIIPETIFDRTQRLPLLGSVSPQEWQYRKAMNVSGPLYMFRVMNNHLYFNPALPADHTIAYEYYSSYFILDTDGSTRKAYWAVDTDTCLLGDVLPRAFLTWAYKKEKGLEYAEDFNTYERQISLALSRDVPNSPVNLADSTSQLQPGIFVPAGSWNV